MKKWMFCALVFSLLFCGCGGPGKSPIIGKKTKFVAAWKLDKMNEKSFSKQWDDLGEILGIPGIEQVVPEDLEDIFEDLAKQKVSVAYRVLCDEGLYLAVDVSPCNKKQKEEVEDILKDDCKKNELRKFYDTERGFFIVGPNTSEFKKAVDKAEFKSWKTEECWGAIQNSYKEPNYTFIPIGKSDFDGSIMDTFPAVFHVSYGLKYNEKLRKYTASLGSDDAVKNFKAKSIVGLCVSANPQKCAITVRVVLDSKETAKKYQEHFTGYMSELGKVLDDKKITAFLTKQKPKLVGNSVVWDFNASWMKSNKDIVEDFKEEMKDAASQGESPSDGDKDEDEDDF